MLGEYDLVGGKPVRAGPPADEHDGAVRSCSAATARPRLVVGSAGSARLRGAIMQIVVNVLEHGLAVEDAISAPRVHLDEPHVHCEGGLDPAELDRLEALGYDVVRWRRRNLFFGGAAAVELRAGRLARGRRRPAARRRRRRRMSARSECRSASQPRRTRDPAGEPGDAAALVALADRRRRRAGGLAARDPRWRSVADERRYIRSVQRHPDAALLVAEVDGEIVGRLSLPRDPHPSSAHVADLGLMVAAAHRRRGDRHGAAGSARTSGPAAPGSRKLELHVFPHNEAAIALYEKVGYEREGYRASHYRLPGRALRRRRS